VLAFPAPGVESFRGNYRHLVTPFKADRLFYLESVTYVSQPTQFAV